jgi:hypothetical protein
MSSVGPNLPAVKRGKNIIMSQGQTAGDYGMDPDYKGPVDVEGEPRELHP